MYPWEFWLRLSLCWWQGAGQRAEQVADAKPHHTVSRQQANVIWVDFRHARASCRTLHASR